MNLELNYYFLGIKPETTEYKISKASYELPKTLNRMYLNSREIINEKMIRIDTYSHQQQMNIYISISTIFN